MIVKINGFTVRNIKTSIFPGGEIYVSLPVENLPENCEDLSITALPTSSNDIMMLLMMHNAIVTHYSGKITYKALRLRYLPYARQDRVCSAGEAFSIKVMAELINSMKFDRVIIEDCHSQVGLALINNSVECNQLNSILGYITNCEVLESCDVIVAPDAGATKKAQEVADFFRKPLVQCLKIREKGTVKVVIHGDLKDKKAVVVDDICDGGATFLALAKEIKGTKELHLIVTHGIFSKGKDALNALYTSVGAVHDWSTGH